MESESDVGRLEYSYQLDANDHSQWANRFRDFPFSNTTNVSISEDTEVNGIIFTSAATNP